MEASNSHSTTGGQSGSRRGGKPKQKGRHFGPAGRQDHGRGNKRKDMGRQQYFRNQPDKRQRNAEEQNKRRKLNDGSEQSLRSSEPFSKEEIDAEDRRPKRKVAVMLGYSGSGYKGMQIVPDQRTIEGDLFKAFIAAGAISKANASDPKKSSLVRCARTDKGVHAAGNVISLKLIIEDDDIVQKINSHLSKQIRVWGIERTIGSFSCYQACDSRWYEYLIPTHCFLPPHPSSYLSKKLAELAVEAGDLDGYQARQQEVLNWWEEAEVKFIEPVLNELDPDVREAVMQGIYHAEPATVEAIDQAWDESEGEDSDNEAPAEEPAGNDEVPEKDVTTESLTELEKETNVGSPTKPEMDDLEKPSASDMNTTVPTNMEPAGAPTNGEDGIVGAAGDSTIEQIREFRSKLDSATKRVRAAYIKAKETYRLSPERLHRVNATLAKYQGTFNFHNYTIRKSPMDPSAKRHIKSFVSTRSPSSNAETGTFEIGGTEWLSVKVHGQSFMMHQIRKMVGMAALVVRCGCPPERVTQTLSSDVVIAVPKAPGLGLLLERPVFDSYNTMRAAKFERDPVGFDKYENEMGEFKEREIYQRIYSEEEQEHVFHTFFGQIDNFKNPAFLYLSSKGFDAVPKDTRSVTSKPIERGLRNRKGVERSWNEAKGLSTAAEAVEEALESQERNAAEAAEETSTTAEVEKSEDI